MAKLVNLARALLDGRVGFLVDETMTGIHEGAETGARALRPLEFRITWGPERLGDWLNPYGVRCMDQRAHGTISVDGLCDAAPCDGFLKLDYLRGGRIRYSLDFEVDGNSYRYMGAKVNIRPWNLPVSHTTCFGRIIDLRTGTVISNSVVYFRLSSLPAFARSVRLRLAPHATTA
jgi:hypothetical protein